MHAGYAVARRPIVDGVAVWITPVDNGVDSARGGLGGCGYLLAHPARLGAAYSGPVRFYQDRNEMPGSGDAGLIMFHVKRGGGRWTGVACPPVRVS